MKTTENFRKTNLKIYLAIVAATAFMLGLSDVILANYFYDAYNVSASVRGMIEFPREIPGILCVVLVSMLSFLGDIKIAIIAQILSLIGLSVLSLITPPFAIMLIFLFLNSMGMHLFMPLQDSIGLSLLSEDDNVGRRMGHFKSVGIAFSMLASILVIVGFASDFFSFKTDIKMPFLIASFVLVLIVVLLLILQLRVKTPLKKRGKFKFLIKKKYTYYYLLASAHGVQKQIMIVFGPWVLIEILGEGAQTISMLNMIGSFIGIFFTAAIGIWIDKFGIKKILYADAFSFIAVYLLYGLLSLGFVSGTLALAGVPVILAFTIFVFDKMSTQMGMIRVVYLRSIVDTQEDMAPTISMGMSIDHVVSILCAILGGIVWDSFGPQYIFFIAAAFSLINVFVAKKVTN